MATGKQTPTSTSGVVRRVLTKDDFERFTRQKRAILERLASGPVTNRELAGIALNYTARLSEMADKGVVYRTEDLGGGLVKYTLVGLDSDGIRVEPVEQKPEQQPELFHPRDLHGR